MDRYDLNINIGSVYGERLERLAAFKSFDDIGHFAALLLWVAIDKNISKMNAELFEALEEIIEETFTKREISEQMERHYRKIADRIWGTEDEIPF